MTTPADRKDQQCRLQPSRQAALKILFVPAHNIGAVSHGIPLLALSQRLPKSYTTALLVPQQFHSYFRSYGANVLDIPHSGLSTQMAAYSRFRPDIVVDDLSVSTALSRHFTSLPRVTVQRIGLFPSRASRRGEHTAEQDFRALQQDIPTGFPRPSSLADIVVAESVVIPAVPSIEPLPEQLDGHSGYFYSGPLLMPDYNPKGETGDSTMSLARFLDKHRQRRLAIVTCGTIAKPPHLIQTIIERLLEQGHAVVSTVPLESTAEVLRDLLYFERFLPLHQLCECAAIIVHHCGSGMYHYPILYGVPSITVGTGYYDRDEVGDRLEKLGASVHLDAQISESDNERVFEQAASELLEPAHPGRLQMLSVLARLKSEADRCSAAFDLEQVLHHALQQPRKPNPRAGAKG
jgi:hypothetical protein